MKYIGDLKNDVLSNFADGQSVSVDMHNEIQRAFNVMSSLITPKQLLETKNIYPFIYKGKDNEFLLDDIMLRPANFLNFEYTLESYLKGGYFSVQPTTEYTLIKTDNKIIDGTLVVNNKEEINIVNPGTTALYDFKIDYTAINTNEALRVEFDSVRTNIKINSLKESSNFLGQRLVVPIYYVDNNILDIDIVINDLETIKTETRFDKKSGWVVVEFDVPNEIAGVNPTDDFVINFFMKLKDNAVNQIILLESIYSFSKSNLSEISYFSKNFIIGADNIKKNISTSNDDILNLTPEEYEIMIYETAKILTNKIVKENILNITLQKFDLVLRNLYGTYSGSTSGLFPIYDTNERKNHVY